MRWKKESDAYESTEVFPLPQLLFIDYNLHHSSIHNVKLQQGKQQKIRQNRERVLPRHKHTAAQMITDDEFIEILILNMLGLDDEIFKDLCMLLSAEFLGSYVIMIYTHTHTHIHM